MSDKGSVFNPRPLFEKRHYEWLASFAKEHLVLGDREQLALSLRRTNRAYNQQRFLEACTTDAERAAGISYNHGERVKARRDANSPWQPKELASAS